MAWEIETSEQVTLWLEGLDDATFDQIMPVIDALERVGPTLGRPLADRIESSKHHNMKELRSIGKHLRILFAFDPKRNAILLIAGDKQGRWDQWYQENVPLADEMYDRHLAGERI
jgi:hypothetical protein